MRKPRGTSGLVPSWGIRVTAMGRGAWAKASSGSGCTSLPGGCWCKCSVLTGGTFCQHTPRTVRTGSACPSPQSLKVSFVVCSVIGSVVLGRRSGAQVGEQGYWGVPLGGPEEKLSNCTFCLGTPQGLSVVITQAGKRTRDVKDG